MCFLFPILVAVVFELNKDHPNENTQTLFMQSWLQRGVSHPRWRFSEAPSRRAVESFQRRQVSGMALCLEAVALGRPRAGSGEAGHLMGFSRGEHFDCLGWVPSWTKRRQRIGRLAVVAQVSAIPSPGLQRWRFGFLVWLLQRLWVMVLGSCIVWPLPVCLSVSLFPGIISGALF